MIQSQKVVAIGWSFEYYRHVENEAKQRTKRNKHLVAFAAYITYSGIRFFMKSLKIHCL